MLHTFNLKNQILITFIISMETQFFNNFYIYELWIIWCLLAEKKNSIVFGYELSGWVPLKISKLFLIRPYLVFNNHLFFLLMRSTFRSNFLAKLSQSFSHTNKSFQWALNHQVPVDWKKRISNFFGCELEG